MMNKKHIAVAFLALFLPFIALAFESGGVPNAAPNLDINSIIDVLFATMWPIIVAILILVFVGIGFLFLNAQGDPSKIASARLALIGGSSYRCHCSSRILYPIHCPKYPG